MSLLDRISGRGRPAIPSNASFRLTEHGREKIQEFSGDNESRILVALETHGSSTIDEISMYSKVSRGAVERLIPTLVGRNQIQYVSGAAGGE